MYIIIVCYYLLFLFCFICCIFVLNIVFHCIIRIISSLILYLNEV